MTRTIAIAFDQFYRPQPGGIATYVRGLVQGLSSLEDESLRLIGVAPRGTPTQHEPVDGVEHVSAPVTLNVLTRLWERWPLGVPRRSDVVHAPSMAGPFGGGTTNALHSVALHDLLWRDERSSSTRHGVRFHERRLQLLKRREDLRILCSSPGLAARLATEGFDPARLHDVRLGVDEGVAAEDVARVRRRLLERGVQGPFTLYVGTREPRKNLDRLAAAHALARSKDHELGPLVLVGPEGWGDVDSADAVVMGLVSRPLLRGLYRDAAVVAYVPHAEGWGLPPVEALAEGARVVASTTTPSVAGNAEVIHVDPLDVEAIADGLAHALALDDDEVTRARRRVSVASFTWRNAALDHLAAWR